MNSMQIPLQHFLQYLQKFFSNIGKTFKRTVMSLEYSEKAIQKVVTEKKTLLNQ